MNQRKPLAQFPKGILIFLTTALLAYITGGWFGSILCSSRYFCDLGGVLIGTAEQYRYIFGFLIAPTLYLSLFFFLSTHKEERPLRWVLFVVYLIVAIVNAAIGLSTILFSLIFAALGYVLAKVLGYFTATFLSSRR